MARGLHTRKARDRNTPAVIASCLVKQATNTGTVWQRALPSSRPASARHEYVLQALASGGASGHQGCTFILVLLVLLLLLDDSAELFDFLARSVAGL